LTRYLDRRDYQCINMDTDSSYKALSGHMHDLVKPELRREFFENYGDWFVTPYCEAHRRDFVERMVTGDGRWDESATCCRDAKRRDTRTPGKFKEEFYGSVMVALNSKTYICAKDEEDLARDFPPSDDPDTEAERRRRRDKCRLKNSCKGLSKKTNAFTVEHYRSVLESGEACAGVNRGFQKKNNALYTYQQTRRGLTYFYAKRRVLEDGVSTTHPDV
jgi:hypothetical protein